MATQEERLIRKYANLQKKLRDESEPEPHGNSRVDHDGRPSPIQTDGQDHEHERHSYGGRYQSSQEDNQRSPRDRGRYGLSPAKDNGPIGRHDDRSRGQASSPRTSRRYHHSPARLEDGSKHQSMSARRRGNENGSAYGGVDAFSESEYYPHERQRQSYPKTEESTPLSEDFHQAVQSEMERQRSLLNNMLDEYRTNAHHQEVPQRKGAETGAGHSEPVRDQPVGDTLRSSPKKTQKGQPPGEPVSRHNAGSAPEGLGILPWHDGNHSERKRDKQLRYKQELERQIKEQERQKNRDSGEKPNRGSRSNSQQNVAANVNDNDDSKHQASAHRVDFRDLQAPSFRERDHRSFEDVNGVEDDNNKPLPRKNTADAHRVSIPANISSEESRSLIDNASNFRRRHVRDPQAAEDEQKRSQARAQQAALLRQQIEESNRMKAREQQLKRDEEAEEEERIERERKELNEQHRKEVGLENNALGPDSEFRDERNDDADAAYKASVENVPPRNANNTHDIHTAISEVDENHVPQRSTEAFSMAAAESRDTVLPEGRMDVEYPAPDDRLSGEIVRLQEQQNLMLQQLQEQSLMMQRIHNAMYQVKRRSELESLQSQQKQLADLMDQSQKQFENMFAGEESATINQRLGVDSKQPGARNVPADDFYAEQRNQPPLWRPGANDTQENARKSATLLDGESEWQTADGVVSRLTDIEEGRRSPSSLEQSNYDSNEEDDYSDDVFEEMDMQPAQHLKRENEGARDFEESLAGESMLVFLPDNHPDIQADPLTNPATNTQPSAALTETATSVVSASATIPREESTSSVAEVSDLDDSGGLRSRTSDFDISQSGSEEED